MTPDSVEVMCPKVLRYNIGLWISSDSADVIEELNSWSVLEVCCVAEDELLHLGPSSQR